MKNTILLLITYVILLSCNNKILIGEKKIENIGIVRIPKGAFQSKQKINIAFIPNESQDSIFEILDVVYEVSQKTKFDIEINCQNFPLTDSIEVHLNAEKLFHFPIEKLHGIQMLGLMQQVDTNEIIESYVILPSMFDKDKKHIIAFLPSYFFQENTKRKGFSAYIRPIVCLGQNNGDYNIYEQIKGGRLSYYDGSRSDILRNQTITDTCKMSFCISNPLDPTQAAHKPTSPFGVRTHPITKKPTGHAGADLSSPFGSKIYAVEDGEVVRVRNNTTKKDGKIIGYGCYVMIKHKNCFTTLYGHLSAIYVKEKQAVTKNQIIGLSGGGKEDPACKGGSTGPHLHFEVYPKPTNSPGTKLGPVDPLPHICPPTADTSFCAKLPDAEFLYCQSFGCVPDSCVAGFSVGYTLAKLPIGVNTIYRYNTLTRRCCMNRLRRSVLSATNQAVFLI